MNQTTDFPDINPFFVRQMQGEIDANARKGLWAGWQPRPKELIDEMQHHLNKLSARLHGVKVTSANGNPCSVAELAADIANFSMKAFEVFGENSAGTADATAVEENNEHRSHVVEPAAKDPKCPRCHAPITRADDGAPWRCTNEEECGWFEARD